jgi:O-antigen ligase
MIKKIVLEKIYIIVTIIIIGGYSAINMLATEHNSVYTTEDPLLMKLLVGMLFFMTSCYVIVHRKSNIQSPTCRILLFISIYMAIWRIIDLPTAAGILSYIYQPMRDLLIVVLFLFGNLLVAKSDDLRDYFTTGMIIALIISAIYYYKNWAFANETDQAHLGTSYYALFLLPTILLTPKKWIKYVAIIIVGVIIISSFKRGGSIALVLGLVSYLFVKEVLLEHKITKLIWFLVLIFILLITLYYIDNAMGNIISGRLLNIVEDGGSGRDQVWATTWNMICTSDIEELTFGHGFNAVMEDSPQQLSAHNDFLEVLYNYGLICFIPYIMLHIHLTKQLIQSIRQKNTVAPVMVFTYTIFICLSLISHIIVYPWSIFIALSWGLQSDTSIKDTNA